MMLSSGPSYNDTLQLTLLPTSVPKHRGGKSLEIPCEAGFLAEERFGGLRGIL